MQTAESTTTVRLLTQGAEADLDAEGAHMGASGRLARVVDASASLATTNGSKSWFEAFSDQVERIGARRYELAAVDELRRAGLAIQNTTNTHLPISPHGTTLVSSQHGRRPPSSPAGCCCGYATLETTQRHQILGLRAADREPLPGQHRSSSSF